MSKNRLIRSYSLTEESIHRLEVEATRTQRSQSSIVNQALVEFFKEKAKRGAWQTVGPGDDYNPLEFYTASEDSKGHSVKATFLVPKNLAGRVAALVSRGDLPAYRTAGDIYRDSVVHRAHQIARLAQDEELLAEVAFQQLIDRQATNLQMYQDGQRLIDSTRQVMELAITRGSLEWVKEELERGMAQANSVPEVYRVEYLKMLAGYQAQVLEEEKRKRPMRVVEGGEVKSAPAPRKRAISN